MKAFLTASAATAALLAASAAWADCGIEKGSVRILSNDFEALHVVASGAEECASPTVQVTKNQTTEHKNIQVPALTTNPATYTVAVVANNSIVPLLNELTGMRSIAPECTHLTAGDFLAPGASSSEAEEDAGIEKYQCCIHPWMRAEVRVTQK